MSILGKATSYTKSFSKNQLVGVNWLVWFGTGKKFFEQ
jgi:hypothetical protein